MKKLHFLWIIILAASSLMAKVTITQLGTDSYKVVWDISTWTLSSESEYSSINMSETGVPGEPGAPLLPFDECKVAIPFGGSVSISISQQSARDIQLDKRILPVPQVIRNQETDAYNYAIDERLYAATTKEILTILPNQRFRKLSFVPIRINPFIYDGKHRLTVVSKVEFIVTIDGNLQFRNAEPEDELTELIARQTINPTQAAFWQTTDRERVNYADFSLSDVWVKIETDKDGMFKITPSQLSMLPITDIDPATFRLFTTGGEVHPASIGYQGPVFREVPIFVAGESDGIFNSSDYILFYGRDRNGLEMNQSISGAQYINPYSKDVCYWLTFGGSFTENPLRIPLAAAEISFDAAAASTPETVRIENETYQRKPIGFEWFMGKFFGNSSSEYNYSIDLEDIDNTQTQTLSLLLKQEYLSNGSSVVHRVRLKVNGAQLLNTSGSIQEWSWVGMSPITITHTGQYFASGNNSIAMNILRTGTDNLFLDYYQVAYQKKLIKRGKQFTVSIPSAMANQRIKYNFTGNNTNLRIFKADVTTGYYNVVEIPYSVETGGFNFIGSGLTSSRFIVVQESEYFTPASVQQIDVVNLAVESSPVNNIIITPTEYLQQADYLAAFYQQNFNKNSKVVQLQDVFNQFNAGMPDPNAIRLFIENCLETYPAPGPASVTLLGSGTIDWRNFSGQSATKNKIIVYQKGESTSDDYFGMFNTELYPEIAIGRYPAKTADELNTMLSNLDRYVTQPEPGIWRNSLVFLADDEFNGATTGEYSHSEQLQDTSNYINKSVLIDKIFAIDYEFDEFQNKPTARDDMMKEINDGKLIWYYIGHGSFDTLGAEDYFKGALDIGRFNNPDKLPLFVAASCDIAQFDSFLFDSLAEKVVLLNNKGAIASIAATRECNGPSNVALLKQYYKFSLNLRNPIGYSLVNAKASYTVYTSNNEKYNILGDPLLLITTPERDSTLTVETPAKDDVLNAREQVNIQGQFSGTGLNQDASVYVFDNEVTKTMPNNSLYTFRGKSLFRGDVTVTNSQYNAGFVVPDDVTTGNTGLIMTYLWNPLQNKDYVNYRSSVALSDQAVSVVNPDEPEILLYLDDMDFVSGDVVSANPVLIAKISDANGINVTDSPGHGILLIMDQTVSSTNVTNYFTNDKDSFTSGTLTYPITGLSEGNHMLQLIAFDNFNQPSVAAIDFVVSKSKSFVVENFLPYPNPMKKSGWFTFTISEPADVKVSIYTIRGRKIKTIQYSASKGYNQIPWDGRDADGDYLANNTYFIKLTAKSLTGKGKAEKTEKLVIYH